MKIDKVRIAGFKSFADPVEVEIQNGMTGIVGPNGCGKSNVVDGFRWAMGETSSKRMRADGMDEVIFGGTDTRPPKSTCEVRITLNNETRDAPAEFNDADILEISRKLQRGDGSTYRVNGKQARARDVQTLFKDAGIGATASAIVSQGKVGALINAKPSERRSLLEEAAGVTGLSARRREAEIKLKATEQNLERAEDMGKGLSDQLNSLRRQARQAQRYQSIDGQIRAAEATAFLVRWKSADERLSSTQARHDSNEERAAQAILALKKAEDALAATEKRAEPLTGAKREAETALALAKAATESFDKEIAAAKKALETAKKNVTRTKRDLERARQEIEDTTEETADLKDSIEMLEEDEIFGGEAVEEAAEAYESAQKAAFDAGEMLRTLEAGVAALEERRIAVKRRFNEETSRVSQAESRHVQLKTRIVELTEKLAGLTDGSEEIAVLAERVEEIAERSSAASEELPAKENAASEANNRLSEVRAKLAALRAELEALQKLSSGDEEGLSKILVVQEGYEKALAAALGEGLTANDDPASDRYWSSQSTDAVGPEWLPSLSRYVSGSDLVASSLNAVGVAIDDDQATSHLRKMKQGMSIVTMDGHIYRWDGYRSELGGVAEQAVKRANRERALVAEVSAAENDLSRVKENYETAATRLQKAREAYNALRADETRLRRELAELEKSNAETITLRSDTQASLRAAEDTLPSVEVDLVALRAALKSTEAEVTTLQEQSGQANELADAKAAHVNAVSVENAARAKLDTLKRESDLRKTKLEDVRRRIAQADEKTKSASALIAELNDRMQEYQEEVILCGEADALAPDAKDRLLEKLVDANELFVEASEKAAQVEAEIADGRDNVRRLTEDVSVVREERASNIAELKAAGEALEELNREIRERLNCETSALTDVAGVSIDDELPELGACESRVARLTREKENIGTVNLLAEEQAGEIEEKLGGTKRAVVELREAVSKLRSMISQLEDESRLRLTDAFSAMDENFQELFTRVFGGGEAHMKLSGSEDILEAGLEIYACPPGKKMQTMSLLSGGEQAMAAIALIFAAFLIRPAPVCVLDEVDAPLDDANVDRLCRLVREMASEGETRFLVVTHHPLTMANCDRLYGVTMAERGVSRIASMDMAEAVAFGQKIS